MMFPWNIAKSAEALLSKFALRRLCKFLLKKKLGQFIHGDIDLDQLDVQLAAGILQLTDLAINVDFINQKLAQTSIFRVREGSIRSLLVKMPWSGGGWEIEVDELELVVSPFCNDRLYKAAGNHDSDKTSGTTHISEKDQHDMAYESSIASISVHEGVKAIAKMVKWLLTSFHIRIKYVIVAVDACAEKDEEKEGSHGTLVLRLTEVECGTCISEDKNCMDGAKPEDFLGITHLTNFLKFEGASVELLQMNDDQIKSFPDSDQVTVSGSYPASKSLLTGERSGIGGSMKLSIPLKNGSLDVRKVDAEICVDPLTAKLQPSTLKWIIGFWEMLQKCDSEKIDNLYQSASDAFFPGLTSHSFSSAAPSALCPDGKLRQAKESSVEFSVPLSEATITDVLFEESRVISDWVPRKCQNDGIEDADLGASVDQFFECFDGMRSSQSVLGSSGIWGWTSSVFTAITAASNLASGSMNISAEQQHVQTNLQINLVEVSVIFSFFDEDWAAQHDAAGEVVDTGLDVHHLWSKWTDVQIAVQVYPQEWKLEATVKHIVLDDCLSRKEDTVNLSLLYHEEGVSVESLRIRGLQDEVQSTLPCSSLFADTSKANVSDVSSTLEASSSSLDAESCACRSNVVKVNLFEASGDAPFIFSVSSKSCDGRFTGQAAFSLKLPPFTLWLNFELVKMVLDVLREVGGSSGENNATSHYSSEAFEDKDDSSACHVTSSSRKGSLQGNVFLPHARIFLCFPIRNDGDFRGYTSWDQFIALDFSSPLNFKKSKAEGFAHVQEGTSWKKDFPFATQSVHLNVANLDIYHISRTAGDNSVLSDEMSGQQLCAFKILSLGNGTDWVRLISMLWHGSAVTGPWIMKSAKLLATTDNPASKMSSATSGFEFAAISTKRGVEDLSSQKQDMIFSSKFCLHVRLSAVVVNLRRSQYLCVFRLLDEVMDAFSGVGSDRACENRETTVNQTSIYLESSPIRVQIELDQGYCPKSSLQRELHGSWHKLRLEIQNLQLLSVTDIGAVRGASFLWISHCEGKLWGSLSTMADQDLLLILCSNSSSGRGDGERSNVLSGRPAGSDIMIMNDPESSHNFMSVTVKCGTVVAPGGRLDWLDKLSSFFILPSPEIGERAACTSQKEDFQRASFILKLIDVALSYEPYSGRSDYVDGTSGGSDGFDENSRDPHIACLLAASSLTLSNTKIAGKLEDVFRIRFQDVGLLLHAVSHDNMLLQYSADHLRKLGYVKVAGESLLNAILRINYGSDISWELYCSESHIVLSTCHDTTIGLVRLASQIQQLLAPDVEESIVHLQNRWNSLQQTQGRDDSKGGLGTSKGSSQETFREEQLNPVSKGKSEQVGLMDEICEDAFVYCEKDVSSSDGSELNVSVNRSPHNEGTTSACSGISLEGCHASNLQKAELIEGYCLADLRSLSDLTINSCLDDISKSVLVSRGSGDFHRGKWYETTSLRVVDDYVPDETGYSSSEKLMEGQQNKAESVGLKKYKGRVLLKNIEVLWRMYAGSDWHELQKTAQHSEDICGRDLTICLELALSNMNVQYDIFPDGDVCVSKLHLAVQHLSLYDKSIYAPWKLVLGYYRSKERPRESSSKALKLDLEAVRPDPTTPLEEYRLRVALLPLLLHLHQSQLDFFISFFGGNYSPGEQSQNSAQESGSSDVISTIDNNAKGFGIADEALLPFFQKFDIWPITVRVDYLPSRFDLAALRGGKYVELVNLVPWKGVELQLKHVQAAGVYGWSNVCETTIGEWLEDISLNQIHKLLQGLPPVRSVVAVGSGAAKLVSLPVKSYKKDRRLVKGLQRGTAAFLRSISIEALGLGVHLAAGAHEILLHTECILTHIQPSVRRPIRSKLKMNNRTDQPEDAKRGFQQAYDCLSDGLEKTASALVRTPIKTYQRGGGVGSALATAVRGAPAAALAPASAAAQAIHSALLGVRNSLDPEHKKESMNKYLGPTHSWEQS